MNHDPIPGTFEEGFVEHPLREEKIPAHMRLTYKAAGMLGLRRFSMGEATILISRDPAGVNGERLWHLTISCPDRHPTWDEIKTARYRLLPADATFGMLLPPSEFYVNVPAQDHVFQLWEVTDPREPWTAG